MSHRENDGGDLYHARDQIDSASLDDGSSNSATGNVALRRGPWTAAEDAILVEYVNKHGEGNWNAVQKHSALRRCGKSCRLRWVNHLRTNLKKGPFTPEEERMIIRMHACFGNKWARMAAQLPGRTDNEIKNYWNTRIKRLQRAGMPLYPPDTNLQASHNNCQSSNIDQFGFLRGHHDIVHAEGFETPPVSFDAIKEPQERLFYSDTHISSVDGSSEGYNFRIPESHRAKMIPVHGSSFSNFDGVTDYSFPFNPPLNHFQNDSFEKVECPFPVSIPSIGSVNPLSHALPNSNFFASKPELPSFQYADAVHYNLGELAPPPPYPETIHNCVQSPPRLLVQPDCTSPRSNRFLQELIHNGHVLNSSNNQSRESIIHSSTVPWETTDNSIVKPWRSEIRSHGKLEAVKHTSNPDMNHQQLGIEVPTSEPDELYILDWLTNFKKRKREVYCNR